MKSVVFRDEPLSKYIKHCTVEKNCIVCGSSKFGLWARVDPFQAVKCSRCSFIWMRPYPTEAGLRRYYSDYIGRRRLSNKPKMRQRAGQYGIDVRILEEHIDRGRMLDVGCSGGFFLSAFNSEFEKHGLEIDPSAVRYARAHFPWGGNVRLGDLLSSPYDHGSFDVILMRGTIEHVPDPVAVLKRMSDLLSPGGYFYVCATPNGASLAAEVFREKWLLFHPIQHIWSFSPATLGSLVGRCGLKLVAKEFPYLGTPYENAHQDLKAMADAITIRSRGESDSLPVSPPFYESIMNVLFRKVSDLPK